MRFSVSTYIEAPPADVWTLLLDWEGSAAWMVDATTVEVLGSQREGVGTRLRAVTRVIGVPLVDVMEVTGWEHERTIEVHHRRWPILGPAWFFLEPEGEGTRFRWVEDLRTPFGLVGEMGGRLFRRPIEAMLRRSLLRFRRLAEQGV